MNIKLTIIPAIAGFMIAGAAAAAPISPTFGTFGDLADAGVTTEFGGDGIPTDATAYDTFTDAQGNSLTLGLTITPRFSAPKPTNDGAGSFVVQPGLGGGRTLWNFSFYAGLDVGQGSTLTLQDIGLELLYDLDAAADTDISDLGSINAGNIPGYANTTTTVAENSQNLSFGYLASGFPTFNTPGLNTFSADAGEYSFLLRANNFTAAAATGVSVEAIVAPIPLPAALPLLLAGLGGLGLMRRRKARAA